MHIGPPACQHAGDEMRNPLRPAIGNEIALTSLTHCSKRPLHQDDQNDQVARKEFMSWMKIRKIAKKSNYLSNH